jgi:hypothetical protein
VRQPALFGGGRAGLGATVRSPGRPVLTGGGGYLQPDDVTQTIHQSLDIPAACLGPTREVTMLNEWETITVGPIRADATVDPARVRPGDSVAITPVAPVDVIWSGCAVLRPRGRPRCAALRGRSSRRTLRHQPNRDYVPRLRATTIASNGDLHDQPATRGWHLLGLSHRVARPRRLRTPPRPPMNHPCDHVTRSGGAFDSSSKRRPFGHLELGAPHPATLLGSCRQGLIRWCS